MADNQQTLPAEVEKVVRGLPQEKQTELRKFIYSQFHSGPLPDPATLERYAAVIPNGAERIMGLLERETKHRHDQDAALISCHTKTVARGQAIGAVLTILLGIAAFQLGMHGHDWLAGVVFTTTIVAVITVFVLGRRSDSEEGSDDSESKREQSSKRDKKRLK